MNLTQIHVAVDGDEQDKLNRVSKQTGVSVSEMCRRGLNLYLMAKNVTIKGTGEYFQVRVNREVGRPRKQELT